MDYKIGDMLLITIDGFSIPRGSYAEVIGHTQDKRYVGVNILDGFSDTYNGLYYDNEVLSLYTEITNDPNITKYRLAGRTFRVAVDEKDAEGNDLLGKEFRVVRRYGPAGGALVEDVTKPTSRENEHWMPCEWIAQEQPQ